LLGAEGAQLIREGGRREFTLPDDVCLGDDLLRVRVDEAVVTVTLDSAAQQRLHWNCTRCTRVCEHVGAALSLVLEEKTALGLAAPPRERKPIEGLDEKELVATAIAERQERARVEKMKVRPVDGKALWTDYLVTSAASGKTYRVSLRGWEPGESYCSCPDFRTNTLGLCKHVLKVQRLARRRFSASTASRPYRPKSIAIHLRYAADLELRLLVPPSLNGDAARIVRPLIDRPITDVCDLLGRIQQLTRLGHDPLVYPDAEAYIERQLMGERLSALALEIRKDPRRHPLRTELLTAELLPYQLDGVAFAAGAGRAILADDMGLGKTIQGIGVAELLAREAGVRRVLIICPASLKSQWRSEIHRFSTRDCQLVIGSAAQRRTQYDGDCFFTICNYEQVVRDILSIENVKWDLIILDEGQRIKNWEAQTSRVVKGLRSPFALVLSGTPLENRLDDLFSIMQFVDEWRLGPAFRFFNRHRIVDETGKVLGFKGLADLRNRLKPILLRRTRASVMRDLPPRTTEIIRIAPTEEQLTMHDSNKRIISQIVNKPYISEMDLLRLRKALLLCRMAANSTFLVDKKDPGFSSKLEALDDLLATVFANEDRKAVLFSEWTTMLGLIEELLKKRGLPYVRLDGSVPQKKRQALVRTFQHDPACRLFIATNAGSTGLNLQAADTVINVDLPWNPAVLEQRIARAHRMGQRRPVQVYVLVTEGTIEEQLLTTLSAKHQLALAALDIESDVDAVDLLSHTEELKRRMEVLIGTRPPAPLDESQRIDQEEQAARIARMERVSLAGGQLLTAAFSFLDQLLPAAPATADAAQASAASRAQQLADGVKQHLSECLESDEKGRPRLTLTLPDATSLEAFTNTLARLMSFQAAEPADAVATLVGAQRRVG
jgi:superfamily II DNA or RNA helicase